MSLLSFEDPLVDHILEAVDLEMASPKKPKVLLFDIGGVCVIQDYERSLGIPLGWINYSISKSAPDGYWQRLERGEILMDKDFFDGFNQDLHDLVRWKTFFRRERARGSSLPGELPPLPTLDGEWFFNEIMSRTHMPDPSVYPALQKLKQSGEYMLGALSNTVIFPPGHDFHGSGSTHAPLRQLFDVFISSAHVGLRKPDPKIYRRAVATLDRFARGHADSERGRRLGWHAGIQARDILFLDDIGENLREARAQGFETIKVRLGRTHEAVERLQEVTGLELRGPSPETKTRI